MEVLHEAPDPKSFRPLAEHKNLELAFAQLVQQEDTKSVARDLVEAIKVQNG